MFSQIQHIFTSDKNPNRIFYLSFFVLFLSCLFGYIIFFGLNELMNSYYAHRLGILKMEHSILEMQSNILEMQGNILEMQHKFKDVVDSLNNIQNTLQNSSPAKAQWVSLVIPIFNSLAVTAVLRAVRIGCHMLPSNIFNITLLGPCLKLFIEGPEGFLLDPLKSFTYSEVQNSLEELNALVDEMSQRIRVLEAHHSRESNILGRLRIHEQLINQLTRMVMSLRVNEGQLVSNLSEMSDIDIPNAADLSDASDV